MIKKYDELIDAAKAIATEVSVSTLCPRLDNLQDKVESFNSGLTELCDRKECHLVNHVNSFTLADGTVNDGYLAGGTGPFLTKSGINRVAKNLKLRLKEGVTDVTAGQQDRSKRDGFSNGTDPRRKQHIAPQNSQRPSVPGVRVNYRGCVLCNEGGHNAASCHHRTYGPVICRTCHLPGHKAKHHTDGSRSSIHTT